MPILYTNTHGDYATSKVIYGFFTTTNTAFAPTTLSASPTLAVYKDNSTTESTAGVTLTVDFDGRTGLNFFAIDTSADGTFYSSGSFFNVVGTAGTCGAAGTSIVGCIVASFTLNAVSSLRPTTAGRTLVVDANGLADANMVKMGPSGSGTAQTARDIGASVLLSAGTGTGQLDFTSGVVKGNVTQFLGTASAGAAGYAGIDWGHINAPTTVVALSGTTIAAVTGQLTAAQIATGVWQDTTVGDFTVASSIGKSLYTSGVVPGGSGGLFVSGSNAGTTTFGALTVTGATMHTGNVSMAAGLTITQSAANAAGLSITGNGTGAGTVSTGGTNGTGWRVSGGATSGIGLDINGVSNTGMQVVGGTSGATFTGGNSSGITSIGGTNADGLTLVGTGLGVSMRVGQTILGNLQGIVGSVGGDVGGKIIGGSASTILGIGARVVDGSGNALAPAATALSNVNYTAARAGYLDNINVGGPVASQADINALNQSASRTLLLQTVPAYERPETGSAQYTVEARTFNKTTGNPVNADTTPTLTATGNISGNLSGNLSAAANPATGVYQWQYTVTSTATLEQVTMGVSATISTVLYTLNAYTQVGDFVSATFTITDQNNLTAIFNKLPVNNIADETLVLAAIGQPVQTGTTVDANVVSMATNTLTAAALATDAVTEIQTGLATPTNITAGTITNVTNLTNAPTSGDFTAAMKNSLNAATPVVTVSGTVVLAASQPDYAPAKASDIPTATINATNDYLYGDKVINTGTVPWEENILISGTGTIISTKKLRSTTGANITDVTTVIGSATES